ncbi:helix-turn-helix domain-containing protein [Oceanicaulis sp. LC35]|uniref:helix-turn-helix domain-containing protein n=1 Tax=Oceanicaulis sp. LC35 TaxID=3349635 RepID=UPI003F8402F6
MISDSDAILWWFGARVRALRLSRGLSQEVFADTAGLDRTYVGGIERGERNIGLKNVKKISDALEISICELFDDNFEL